MTIEKIMMQNYRKINYEVMTDTKQKYESLPELIAAVEYSVTHQYKVSHEKSFGQPLVNIS